MRGKALAVALCALSVSGCAGTVSVEPPDPPVSADHCTQFMSKLPGTLADQASRETDPDSPLTAAWGDPAITVRCGVPTPDALTPDSVVYNLNGVVWFPEELTAGYVFTTYQRQSNVEVTVPDDYAPEANVVTELSDLVAETVPKTVTKN